MKTIVRLIVLFWTFTALPLFAIEGLQIGITNATTTNASAMLSWPSDTSETYLIQYRNTLNVTDSWATLQDYYPPDYSGSNVTYFFDTNLLNVGTPGLYPPGTNTGGGPNPTNNGGPTGPFTNGVPGSGFYRVVRDGIHMIGVTNGAVWSGIVQIPLEVGNINGSLVTISIEDSDQGAAVANSIQTAPFSAPLFATVDTTLMSNGTYNLQAFANWNDGNGDDWDAYSPVFSITTSNEITFENWMPQFGSLASDGVAPALLFNATSAHTNVDWTVNIYDSSNNYVTTISSNTPDGNISFTWDLTDTNGVAHTNDPFFSFEISTPYIDPPTPNIFEHSDPWTAAGQWCAVVQRAWGEDNSGSLDVEGVYTELNNELPAAKQIGGVVPPTNPSDGSGFPIPQFDPSNPSGTDAAWATFRNTLYDPKTRNLLFIGKCAEDGLGNGSVTNRFISANEIAATLGNKSIDKSTNHHAFRFVFIDGGETASGKLCEAFGIPHDTTKTTFQYIQGTERPRVFCGWPDGYYGGVSRGGSNSDHYNYIQQIFSEISQYSLGMTDGVVAARRQPNVYTYGVSKMQVYGAIDLMPFQYNSQ